jgi:hypothetical protein
MRLLRQALYRVLAPKALAAVQRREACWMSVLKHDEASFLRAPPVARFVNATPCRRGRQTRAQESECSGKIPGPSPAVAPMEQLELPKPEAFRQ